MNTSSEHTTPIDIFDAQLPVTNPSIIVGAGPLGSAYINRIPDNIYTVAVNGSIQHLLNFDLWICTSPEAPGINPQWWEFGLHSGVESLMDHRMREHNPTYACRQYAYNKAPKRLGESYLVAGGTVAGVATDMLIKQGCRHIVYCGVDMTGHAHADGSTCDGKRSEGDIWGYKRGTLQTMIYRAQDNGIRIESLSPTLLDVPVARELLQQWH